MAKITIEVDTEEKTIMVDMDGTKLENVSNIYVYQYADYEDPDENNLSIEVSQYEKLDKKITKTTRYSAYASELKNEGEVQPTKTVAAQKPKVSREDLYKALFGV